MVIPLNRMFWYAQEKLFWADCFVSFLWGWILVTDCFWRCSFVCIKKLFNPLSFLVIRLLWPWPWSLYRSNFQLHLTIDQGSLMKRNGKRSGEAVWQTPLNDKQCIGEMTQRRYKYVRFHNLLRTDLGRSAGATIVIQPVRLNWGSRAQPSHYMQSPWNQKDKYFKIPK